MNFENQMKELKVVTGIENLELKIEAGCRFVYLPQFFKAKSGELVDCLFACDQHQGYANRLWFAKDLSAEVRGNWNHKNFCIVGRLWSAFSMKGKGKTLSEILLSHLAGVQ
ncbi:hypothetical protein [Halobacteriovorax sp. ZH1_bin.1]|uniref:hypothetical protein n=1 Tax=Halobacteriovorax sp. ZH1_bin.1 TaxID=3157723 RepID=UPI0037213E7D